MAKNLIKNRDVYNRYYGDFRGVDFSSDHTQVIEQRLAYAVNMYKDYQSGQGKALETIPGFRRRVNIKKGEEIYGIHQIKINGKEKVLIHAGENLYLWHNYPHTLRVDITETYRLENYVKQGNYYVFSIDMQNRFVAKINTVSSPYGTIDTPGGYNNITYENTETGCSLTYRCAEWKEGDWLTLTYWEGDIEDRHILRSDLNNQKSTSFVFNNRLYIIDGKKYIYYDGEDAYDVCQNAYVPTTYINIIPTAGSRTIGTENERRNMLQPYFKHTFIADGSSTDFYMNEPFDAIVQATVYGSPKECEVAEDENGDKFIRFATAPAAPEAVNKPKGYAGVEITVTKYDTDDSIKNIINKCTIPAVFDDRVFLAGNPDYPNNVYFCGRNSTGYVDPSYFPVENFVVDGVGTSPVTGMLVVADTLMVLKGDTQQDGSVYYHTPLLTEDDIYAKTYPHQRGLAGIGCLGACVNFLDDPVFVSRLGVEGVGQLSARYERAIEHRSSLIDAKLVNTNLAEAELEEWNGYLFLLVDGKMFLADSRQRYMHDIGVMQYEWYYLEDIGVYPGQYPEYRYASQMYHELIGKNVIYDDKGEEIEIPLLLAKSVFFYETGETKDLTGIIANPPDANGQPSVEILHSVVEFTNEDGANVQIDVDYVVHEVRNELTGEQRYEAYLCESKGSYTGGIFKKACNIKNLDDNLFFGTEDGNICSFNFDKRNEWGEIPPQYYSFDERVIKCGCATKMDCCGIPHLTKNTVKKSTVIKTKTLPDSSARIKVRTNNKPYNQIARINSKVFSFDNIDFSDYSFVPVEQSLFSIKEKEKQWVEKQYYIYSDDYLKPFALYYISYRYVIAGRYKE